MIIVELLGYLVIFMAVWILWRLAATRPEQPELRLAARLAAIAYVVFLAISVIDFGYIADHPDKVLSGVAALASVFLIIAGYRWLLQRARDKADRAD